MQIVSTLLKRRAMIVALVLLFVGAYSTKEVLGDQTGVFGRSKVGCTDCHGVNPSPSTIVKISTDAPKLVVGQTYDFQFLVRNPSQAAAGCDISVDKGTLAVVTGQGLKRSVGDLTHNSPKPFTGDSAVFKFKYTTPATPGTYHIYAAGNAVNFNGHEDTGDKWNTTSLTMTVVAADGAVDDAHAVAACSIAPNPATNLLTLTTPVAGNTSFKLIDAAGRVAMSRQNFQMANTETIDVHTLASGSYVLHLITADGNSIDRKIVISR